MSLSGPRLLLALWTLSGIAGAQEKTVKFEVASVREHEGGVRELGGFSSFGNRVEYRGFGIAMLILEAWNGQGDVVASPDLPSSVRIYPMMDVGRSAGVYEIVALAPEGTTPTRDEFRVMLQGLLADRFKVAIHREKREKSVLILSAEGKSQLKVSAGEGTCQREMSRTPQGQKLVAKHCPIATLISYLLVNGSMYDETGLTGFYDFEITSALPRQSNDPQAISPYSAVKELGLKLEEKKRMIDTIVIDRAEKPGEN